MRRRALRYGFTMALVLTAGVALATACASAEARTAPVQPAPESAIQHSPAADEAGAWAALQPDTAGLYQLTVAPPPAASTITAALGPAADAADTAAALAAPAAGDATGIGATEDASSSPPPDAAFAAIVETAEAPTAGAAASPPSDAAVAIIDGPAEAPAAESVAVVAPADGDTTVAIGVTLRTTAPPKPTYAELATLAYSAYAADPSQATPDGSLGPRCSLFSSGGPRGSSEDG